MKKLLSLLIIFNSLIVFADNYYVFEPTQAYCESLGYSSYAAESGEEVFCSLPNGDTVNSHDFLSGNVGQEYNFCGVNGYNTEVENGTVYCIIGPKRYNLFDLFAQVDEEFADKFLIEDIGNLDFNTCGDGYCSDLELGKDFCSQDCEEKNNLNPILILTSFLLILLLVLIFFFKKRYSR